MIKACFTDFEGVWAFNDNAFEICQEFLPDGARFFEQVSLYDDYLAEIAKKLRYQAGNTLALILPFLKVFGLTEQGMRDYSKKHLDLVPGAKKTLQEIQAIMPTYIISTSYSPFIDAACEVLEFPTGQTFSSKIFLDRYNLSDGERAFLKDAYERILNMPHLQIEGCITPDEIDAETRAAILALDIIFWECIARRPSGELVANVKIIGGQQKAEIVKKLARNLEVKLSQAAYIGDSITDVPAFRTVQEAGGTTISFNGNHWAVEAAEHAVISEEAEILYHLLYLLREKKVFEVACHTAPMIIRKSQEMRQLLRGKAGALG